MSFINKILQETKIKHEVALINGLYAIRGNLPKGVVRFWYIFKVALYQQFASKSHEILKKEWCAMPASNATKFFQI